MPDRPDRGVLLIVSSPSGAGKTTLSRRLVQEFDALEFSVSYTTRAPRGAEQDGADYHFVDDATFSRMVEEGRFAEWALVHGHRYGTTQATIEAAIGQGRDLVFDIDWQGGEQLTRRYPDEALLVFLLPPTMEVLERRLRGRGTDAEEVIGRRLIMAREELEQAHRYHYMVVNDDLQRAYDDLRSIYRAAHLVASRSRSLVRDLLAGH